MPETAYRMQVVNVPVTTYQPVTTYSVWGTYTTALMPVTTYASEVRQVPITTYRPVISTVYTQPAPVAACPSCAAAAPAYSSGACPGGACGPAIPTVEAPTLSAAPTLQPAPTQQPSLAPQPAPTEPAPSLSGEQQPTSALKPLIPDPSAGSLIRTQSQPGSVPAAEPLQDLNDSHLKAVAPPSLLDPHDKTAAASPAESPLASVAAWIAPQDQSAQATDSGWHAARR